MGFATSFSLSSRRILALACSLLAGSLLVGCGSDLFSNTSQTRQEGIKLYNNNQFAEAAGAFTSVVKQQPQDYLAHYYLGRTFEAMKNYHQAIKCYRTSLAVMKSSIHGAEDADTRYKVLDSLASAIVGGNDIVLEQRAFASPEAGPQSADEHFMLAKVRRLQKDADSALDEYRKAAAADPQNAVIAKETGLYLLELNQRTQASRELRRAYVLNRRVYKEDEQVVAALRKLDVVPGPSLGEERDLAYPVVPPEFIPDVEPVPANQKVRGQATANP